MGPSLDLSARINLKRTCVLVLDGNPQSLDLIKQILIGFGVRAVHACQHVRVAQRVFYDRALDTPRALRCRTFPRTLTRGRASRPARIVRRARYAK